ncbi:MAG: hypothetical protein IJV37_07395 [Bacteroidales bacterium]|nr:hypothetical protein [Bacteroidales bacterium]
MDGFAADLAARRLAEAGFANVRAVETDDFTVFTVENDYYKIPAEGFARAVQIVEGAGLDETKPIKIIGTSYKIPEVTMTYDPQTGLWSTTKRLDASWDAVRRQPRLNDSFGKVDINVYPQVSLKNLIITQVYQSLWQLSPAIETSLWPGGKISLQVKVPIYNDGYNQVESLVHPGFLTVSQRFRDPWHLNIFGKLTAGIFNANYIGATLEMAYWFPNERFWVDGKVGVIDLVRFGPSSVLVNGQRQKGPLPDWLEGFWLHTNANPDWTFVWNVAFNYYWPLLQTQFLLRAERYTRRDYGLKFEMIRHFKHCSIGFYLMKGPDRAQHTNGGFRFQVALPPYRRTRHGYWPRVSTSGQMGMSYNANNEQYYYHEFRSEASDNIMSKNYYNPYYINSKLGK